MKEKELVEELMLTDEEIGNAVYESGEGWLETTGQTIGKSVAKAQIHKALTTPITIERECWNCNGKGDVHCTPCHVCNGTGKVSKTFTIKEAIEEKLK